MTTRDAHERSEVVGDQTAIEETPSARAKALKRKLPVVPAANHLVPARMINEVLYCERLMYLEWVQGEEPEPYVARSVSLSSEGLGITAKMDLVEVDGGAVVPIEYKRGTKPDLPQGALEGGCATMMGSGTETSLVDLARGGGTSRSCRTPARCADAMCRAGPSMETRSTRARPLGMVSPTLISPTDRY
jgi:hypothetical protein